MNNAKMFCEMDEFNHDIIHNQLIKTTLYRIYQSGQLPKDLSDETGKLLRMFQLISLIRMRKRNFREMKLHRNNQHYGFVLNVCELIYDCMLINEDKSKNEFVSIDRDHQAMARLFENFVLHFYQVEQAHYKAKSEIILWDAFGDDVGYLPNMRTDISFIGSDDKLIMDTKFYHQTTSSYYDTEKVKSENLYQLMSYLVNDHERGRDNLVRKGILLYPQVGKDLDVSFTIKGFDIRVCTVNLNENWQKIHERLMGVIGTK